MLVIGITGTLGAGKGTIVEYLVKNKGFNHLSVRGFIVAEIEKQGLPVNRDSMVIVANKLRAENSPSYIIDQLYKQAITSGVNCVIESIRTPGEVNSLREKGDFFLFAVDADPKERYNRIFRRKSETDNISYETFIDNEEREMHSTDPNHQNIKACMNAADFIFKNDGSVEQLVEEVEKALGVINSKSHC